MDPEAAFLQQLQASSDADYLQSSVSDHPVQKYDDDDDEEDYDPSALMPESSYQANDCAHSQTPQAVHSPPANNAAILSPIAAATASSKDSRPTSTVQNQQPDSTTRPNKQPRTVGGFIVDDEDDEDETPFQRINGAGANGLLGVARSTSTPQRSVSKTPNNNASSHVQIDNDSQDLGVSVSVPNGASNAISAAAALPTPDLPKQGSEERTNYSSAPAKASNSVPTTPVTSFSKTRLPNDRVGILEDRIAEDPRGDLDAWLSLISEYRNRDKIADARSVYDRFLEVFPTAAEQWVAYVQMELDNGHLNCAEKIFGRSLLAVLNIDLWSTYLSYIRRRNPLVTDTTGKARQTVSQVYDFVLSTIGIDKDSGQIWQDYIDFIRSGPGQAGGTGWQDQQKMDLLRKAYQRAVCVPTEATTTLWKEYDAFERGVNKTTGPKFMKEKSASYITARAANIALSNTIKGLKRTTVPTLPPRPGFDGEAEYLEQVEIWKRWISWEKDDPLVLKNEDADAYKERVVYVYKQALMALRFWPEMWHDAAEYCFQIGRDVEGEEFLSQGLAANPESCLLTFKLAERRELANFESAVERSKAVREPYDKLLDALYTLHDKTKSRGNQAVTRLQQASTDDKAFSPGRDKDEDGEYDKGQLGIKAREDARKLQIEAVQNGYEAEQLDLQKMISTAWIGLMRATRRVLGKGNPKDKNSPGGLREVFLEARKRGRITSDVYVASAHMEWQCYQDNTALRLFERGMKLFKEDEYFALEYLKFLLSSNDATNARAVFETTVKTLTEKSETVHKAKVLFKFFHGYESQFGELSQIRNLEKRMAELFPEDPQLALFTERFSSERFNAIAYRLNISPATQSRPKLPPAIVNSIEGAQTSPNPLPAQAVNSPKRRLPSDESDSEQPRKFARGESPLKGAAGRRQMQNQKRNQQRLENIAEGGGRYQPAPTPLPQQIMGLLNVLPGVRHYDYTTFPPDKVIDVLKMVDLSRAKLDRGPAQMMGHTAQSISQQRPAQLPPNIQPPMAYGQPNYGYGYPR